MLLSKSCTYGIRAILYLSSLQENGYVSIKHISVELDISFHFLTKIFQKLTQEGILQSYRGPNGGVMLARPPDTISLMELVLTIDGPSLFTECVLGLPGCGVQTPCPLHAAWVTERQRLEALFNTTTLATLAVDLERLDLRLKGLTS